MKKNFCWNIGCIVILITTFIISMLPLPSHNQKSNVIRGYEPIIQSKTKTTFWKRGSNPSKTTINECSSTSVIEEKSRKSTGWTTIRWEKHHDHDR